MRPFGRRQPLVDLPGALVGIEDDLPAPTVYDQSISRFGPSGQLLEADHEGQTEGLGEDRRVRGLAAAIGGQAHHTGPFELEGIERRKVDAHRQRPGRRAVARARFGKLEQGALQPVADGIDIADSVAKVAIVETGKDRRE